MHTLTRGVLVCLVALAATAAASADTVVHTWTFGGGFGIPSPTTGLRVVIGHGPGSPSAATRLFDSILLPPSTSSQVLEIHSNADDPQFSTFMSTIKNGVDDQLNSTFWNDSNFGGSTWNPESLRLGLTPDLIGQTIDYIRMTVAPFKLTTGGGFYNIAGIDTSAVMVTVEFMAVPEPTAAILLLAGASGTLLRRRPRLG